MEAVRRRRMLLATAAVLCVAAAVVIPLAFAGSKPRQQPTIESYTKDAVGGPTILSTDTNEWHQTGTDQQVIVVAYVTSKGMQCLGYLDTTSYHAQCSPTDPSGTPRVDLPACQAVENAYGRSLAFGFVHRENASVVEMSYDGEQVSAPVVPVAGQPQLGAYAFWLPDACHTSYPTDLTVRDTSGHVVASATLPRDG